MTDTVTEDLLMVPNRLASPVTFSGQSDSKALHGAIKVYDGDTYLFIANDSRDSQTTTISVTNLYGTGTVLANWNDPASGNITFTSGSCSNYTIPPCTAATYRFAGDIGTSTTTTTTTSTTTTTTSTTTTTTTSTTSTTTTTLPPLKGDFDNDGDVDFWDFMAFIDVYGLTDEDPGWLPNGPRGDFDSDGDVDFWDFMAFIDVYGITP